MLVVRATQMGLDQYAYAAAKSITDERKFSESIEIAYWRKHPNLQGWMERLWLEKNPEAAAESQESDWGSNFNGVELELTWEDLDRLEADINAVKLPKTTGFFFGQDGDAHYKEQDLAFIRKARAELFSGLRVFYNSSW